MPGWDDTLARVEDEIAILDEDLQHARRKRQRLAGAVHVGDRDAWRRQLAVYETSENELADALDRLRAAAAELQLERAAA